MHGKELGWNQMTRTESDRPSDATRKTLPDIPFLKLCLRNGTHLWTPSYFAATTGAATLATIKRYIENQRAPAKRRPPGGTSSRPNPADPSPLAVLQQAAYCLHWSTEPRGFYEAAVSSLLAQRRCTFSELTVSDLLQLSDSAASAYADALEKRLLK